MYLCSSLPSISQGSEDIIRTTRNIEMLLTPHPQSPFLFYQKRFHFERRHHGGNPGPSPYATARKKGDEPNDAGKPRVPETNSFQRDSEISELGAAEQ